MKSRIPKVLHTLCGRTLLGHALAAADELNPARLVVVVGHGREPVTAQVAAVAPRAQIVRQDEQLGTGHAVRMVTEAIGVVPGTVVVSYGDMPLLRGETLRELVERHHSAGNAVTVLTARGRRGRIRADRQGRRRRVPADCRGARRDARGAGHRRVQLRLLCLRRDPPGGRDQAGDHQQRAAAGVPHRCRGHPARRRPPGRHHARGRRGRDHRGQRPGPAGAGPAGAQRPDTRRLDAGRGHHHRPRVHLDRRYGHDRAGRRDRPADPAPGCHRHRRGRQGRARLPA